MPEYEYALEEEDLSTERRRVILLWDRDLDEVKSRYKIWVAIDEENVAYGGKRTKKYRILERPVPAEPTIFWEES